MDVKFGTSGLRGLAADLAAGPAFAHVHGFCAMLLGRGDVLPGDRLLVARDRRPSSPLLARQAMTAIRAAGLQAEDCGLVPTPALAHYAFSRNCASVMITGSHIPADRNGLKFYLPAAEVGKDEEAAIARLALSAPGLPDGIDEPPLHCLQDRVLSEWRSRHAGILPDDALSGLVVGVHEHSSVATGFLGDLLAAHGASIRQFGATQHFVPVDTEAVEPEIIALYRTQAAIGLDAIISTDADGDRPLVADETGTPLPGDLIAWLAADLAGADTIATPVTSNSALQDRPGLKIRRTRIGSPFVIAAMDEAIASGASRVAGFEANGGFLLATPTIIGKAALTALPTRDSTLPILATLARMKSASLKASALAASQGFRSTAGGRLKDFPVERSRALIAALADDSGFAASLLAPIGQIAGVDATDGLRFALADGRIVHFRPSGNAPEMRCYAEAETAVEADRILVAGLEALAASAR